MQIQQYIFEAFPRDRVGRCVSSLRFHPRRATLRSFRRRMSTESVGALAHRPECGRVHVSDGGSNLPQLYNVRFGGSLVRPVPSGGRGGEPLPRYLRHLPLGRRRRRRFLRSLVLMLDTRSPLHIFMSR